MRSAPREREEPETSGPSPPAEGRHSTPEWFCPNCGAELTEFKCKLLCPERACGYYMSCSDFY